MKRLLIACALLTLVAGASAATQTQGQARDARALPQAAPTGTAELAVIVTTDEQQPQPIRRVSVAIQAGELDVPRIGVTDDEGRLVFRQLQAGNYLLTATRPGYVRTFYGSALPGRGPGVAVTVLDGQRVNGIRIRMLRGSVVTGVVRNVSGRPAPNQQVQAIMVRSSGGEKRAINVDSGLGQVTTDDRGVYRIFGLAPGDYIVSVPALAMAARDMRQMTAAELRWADKAVEGAAAPAGSPAAIAPEPPGGPTIAYSPVYYPGTAVASEAMVLTLGPNEERSGVDFALQLVPTAQIKGRVVDTDGRPQPNLQVQLKPARPDGLDLFASLMNSSASTTADGTFAISGVKPGTYVLTARGTPRGPVETPATPVDPAERARQMMAAMTGGSTGGQTHWAEETVAIQGRDLPDITMTLRPGMTLTGRIVYDATTKAPPTDLTKTALSLTPATEGPGGAAAMVASIASMFGGGTGAAKVAADGTFSIAGIAPGRYRLNTPTSLIPIPGLSAPTGGWTLKSVMSGNYDIADAPIDIKAGTNVSGVVVTFTDHPAELSGTVFDGAGRVTPNFPIVVFATDRAYWTMGSRRVQAARPSSDGKYRVTGLPPGEYYVCAVTAVDRTEVYDPAFLEQLVAVSPFKITVAAGEKKTQDLKLGGGRP